MARYLVLIGFALTLLTSNATAQRLKVGSEAPTLEIAEWMRGEPVDMVAGRGKSVYVCGECGREYARPEGDGPRAPGARH